MAQPTGSNMFGCFPLVVIVAMLGFLVFGALQPTRVFSIPVEPAPATGEQGQSDEGRQSLTVIEKIETQVSATVPATITLHVSGYQPDGCKFPVQVNQTRSGDTVTVKIYRLKPIGVMCTMDLNPYDNTITLDGTFESGTYTVDVNGTTVEIKV